MGDIVYPPPDFYPPGIDCYACTPALYESGAWPSVLYATFTGMSPCAGHPHPPNDHHFQIRQTLDGCIFTSYATYAGSDYYVQLNLSTSELYIVRESPIYGAVFFAQEAPCSLIFPTNLNTCPLHAAEGGSAIVTPTPTPLTSYLCGSCHFLPWQNTRSESQQVAMDHELVRLANKADHSCCHFYIDREDIPAL